MLTFHESRGPLDPTRFATGDALRAFAGTAPVTIACGRSRHVEARRTRNRRLADTCHWLVFSMLTKSPGARAHYDRRRAAGEYHNAPYEIWPTDSLAADYHCRVPLEVAVPMALPWPSPDRSVLSLAMSQ